MIDVDYYDFHLAIDPVSGTIVPDAVATIYSIDDLAFATPLPITDVTGSPMTELVASPTGVYPQFMVPSGDTQVYARTALGVVTPITSMIGNQGPAGAAGPPGAGVPAPTPATEGYVLTQIDGVWVAAPGGGGSGIAGAPAEWPDFFPALDHTHPVAQINDATTIGKAVMLAATTAAARSAIGAGTGNGTSNLALGTTSTTAAAGNHAHSATSITFTPTTGLGALAAADVQGAIVQAGSDPHVAALINTAGSLAQLAVDARVGGGGGGVDAETVRDIIGATLVQGSRITVTVNDAGDIVTIAAAAVGIADLPAGSAVAVYKVGATWPARPTARADITVIWIGPGTSPTDFPAVVTSGTAGMRQGIDIGMPAVS